MVSLNQEQPEMWVLYCMQQEIYLGQTNGTNLETSQQVFQFFLVYI